MKEQSPVPRADTEAAPEPRSYLIVFAIAAGLAMLPPRSLADAAGLDALRRVTSHFDPRWLAICVGGQIVAYLGYVLALRNVARADGGPHLSLGLSARTVVAGFGVHGAAHVSGGLAVDYWALRRAGLERKQAIARVACLGTLELAVIAAAGLASALVLLAADAHIQASVTWPWLLVVPGLLGALWVTSPRRCDRLADSSAGGRHPKRLRPCRRRARPGSVPGHAAAAAPAGFPRRRLLLPRRDRLSVGVVEGLLGRDLAAFARARYATGSIAGRRSLPAGGAGIVEVLMTFALVCVGSRSLRRSPVSSSIGS